MKKDILKEQDSYILISKYQKLTFGVGDHYLILKQEQVSGGNIFIIYQSSAKK